MPLPAAKPRKHLHTRRIHCEGFKREDGLWDIEARLIDDKTYSMENYYRGEIGPGTPIHDMTLRVSIDIDFKIHEVSASMDDTPFGICPKAVSRMERLEGLQIGPGWMAEAADRIGQASGCTHLYEMLRSIATTGYQTLHHELEAREKQKSQREQPGILNRCVALASDSPVVEFYWPDFYTGEPSASRS